MYGIVVYGKESGSFCTGVISKNSANSYLCFKLIYFSSNINEAIRSVLHFFIFFMIRFYMHKKHKKALKAQKHNQTKAQTRKQANRNTNALKKHLSGEKSLIRLFA